MPIPEKILDRFRDDWKNASPTHQRQALGFFADSLERFQREGLADRIFMDRLEKGAEYEYKQRLAEVLFAAYLWQAGFALSSSNAGPDFKAEKEGKQIWFELVTPEPIGIDPTYLTFPERGSPAVVRSVPHADITLRWTSALKEKAEKLLGNAEKGIQGYLSKGIVKADEPYVIVINSNLLSAWSFDSLTGVSQFPYPVEICFGVGPLAMQIDRMTGDVIWSGRRQRLELPRENKGAVPTQTFLDERNAGITALLGINLDANFMCGHTPYSVAAHNPYATNAVNASLIPAKQTWVCRVEENGYTVEQLNSENN